MKRMTSSNYNPCVNCIYSSSCSHIKYNAPVCPERARYDRLAAYEDTGLEPEKIEKAMDIVKSAVSAFEDFGVDRLAELAQADREGRCVVLPIKLPGFGWYCNDEFPDAISAYFDYPSQVVDCMEDYILRETKEEAEAALRREQE